ncbi:hypothetical protein MTO96_024997 [Rhipicephalus appendiculatus]
MAPATFAWLREPRQKHSPGRKLRGQQRQFLYFICQRHGSCLPSPAKCTTMPGPPVVDISVSHRGLSPQVTLSVRGARSRADQAGHLSDYTDPEHNRSSEMIGRTALCDGQPNGAVLAACTKDVDDDMTSSRIPSPVTPATFTGSKYTSQTRTPRRLQQRVVGAARRRVTSAPPRVRVVVLSKNGTPTSLALSPD